MLFLFIPLRLVESGTRLPPVIPGHTPVGTPIFKVGTEDSNSSSACIQSSQLLPQPHLCPKESRVLRAYCQNVLMF